MNRLLVLITIVLMSVSSAWAQETQEGGTWARWRAKAQATWTELKVKANTYWEKWKSEDRAPSSEKTAVVDQDSTEAQAPVAEQAPQPAAPIPVSKEIKQAAEQVKAARPVTIAKPARVGDASLSKSKSGVPVFKMETVTKTKSGKTKISPVTKIPLLDIGEEAQVSRSEWSLSSITIDKIDVAAMKPLDSPALFPQKEIHALVIKPFEKAGMATKLEVIKLALPEGISLDQVQKINYLIVTDVAVILAPYKEFTDERMNLLKGLILAEYNKKCHLAVGLLGSVKDKLNAEENQLRDYYHASCIHEMGFFTDSIPALLEIVKKGVPEFSTKAIDVLTKDVPREFVKEVGSAFKNANESWVSVGAKSNFHYYVALSESMKKKYDSALSYALKVSPESKKYPEAQYIAVVSEYMLDKIKDSVERQQKLLADLPKYNIEAPIQALIKLNLGRIAYRSKDYKKAIESYQFIDKSHPMWIQALTEQGWMQILSKDAVGAIGNMHSLHSPFFNSIYKPESYVVRTIGYINICQFGDAYRSLSYLEAYYKPWLDTMANFRKSTKSNGDYYSYVITNLKSKAKETDGRLPMTIVKEIGRQKDFVNYQTAINNSLDQFSQYAFIRDLVRKEQRKVDSKIAQVKTRIADFNAKIEGAKKKVDDQKFVEEWKRSRDFDRDMLGFYEFEKQTYSKTAADFGIYESASKGVLVKWSARMKDLAGEALKNHLTKAEKQLGQILENNEFLRYEVYAGSGENIRYISAGGNTERRMPVSAEPKDARQKWNFDGEFWADEIGHYRSTLKDNCATNVSANSQVN